MEDTRVVEGPLARWRAELAAWRIDPEVLARAPESPWGCPVDAFRSAGPTPPDSPARRVALDALPNAGSVLDVGCGAGAASMALVPPAAFVVGVDESTDMLRAFSEAAGEKGVAHRAVHGRWPDAARETSAADVVVCHHVAYNVPDLDAFARALDAHARRRVVLELTATHPLTWLGPLWRRFHGQDRPDGPTADLAVAVLREAGLPVNDERARLPARTMPFEVRVAFTRRRLCLPVDREPEVARLLRDAGPPMPREIVTLWWDARGGGRE